jgi:DNA-binding transcriptional MocR family regulator
MAKRATAFELVLPLPDAGRLAHRWLYDALRTEILEGRLRPGARLPATRDLAGPVWTRAGDDRQRIRATQVRRLHGRQRRIGDVREDGRFSLALMR